MKKQLIIIGSIVICLMTLFIFWPRPQADGFVFATDQETEITAYEPEPILEIAVPTVVVDVKGSVQHPGIYELPAGSRVHDAIIMAGGFTEEAEPDFINLAQLLQDEKVVQVPSIHDEPLALPNFSQHPADDGLININTATAAQLQTLPGIGATRAEAIIRYREDTGPFAQLEDLKNVSGIGGATFENLKHLITH